jgi:hypothetical protein
MVSNFSATAVAGWYARMCGASLSSSVAWVGVMCENA